jgi:hypothetical protein
MALKLRNENLLRSQNSRIKVLLQFIICLITLSDFIGRKSFVYEQISDKNKTSLIKSQFSRKATVKVTTTSAPSNPLPSFLRSQAHRCDCKVEQGKTVRVNEYYFLKSLGKVRPPCPPRSSHLLRAHMAR